MFVSCSRRCSTHILRSQTFHTSLVCTLRHYSDTPDKDRANDSIFASDSDPWGHVFSDIGDNPPLSSLPPPTGHTTKNKFNMMKTVSHPGFASSLAAFPEGSIPLPSSKDSNDGENIGPSRTSIRGAEVDAFNSLFDTIFSSVEKQVASSNQNGLDWKGDPLTVVPGKFSPSSTPFYTGTIPKESGTSTYKKMRRVTRSHRWTPEDDAELQKKRHEMEIIDTNEDLLQWARDVLFAESIRYEEAAREAVKLAEKREQELRDKKSQTGKEKERRTALKKDVGEQPAKITSALPLQPPTYPHLLAHLLNLTTHKFHAPHLTLSLFSHARSLSVASRVLGCTKEVYYEYLSTLWSCFRDLKTVRDTLQDMLRDGILVDRRVEKDIIGPARQWIGDRAWDRESSVMTGRKEYIEEMRRDIDQIERLVYLSEKPLPKSTLRPVGRTNSNGDGNRKGKGKNKKNKKWADIGVKFRARDSEKWKTDALVFSNSLTPSSVGSAHDKNPYLGSITKNANTDWEFGFGDEGR